MHLFHFFLHSSKSTICFSNVTFSHTGPTHIYASSIHHHIPSISQMFHINIPVRRRVCLIQVFMLLNPSTPVKRNFRRDLQGFLFPTANLFLTSWMCKWMRLCGLRGKSTQTHLLHPLPVFPIVHLASTSVQSSFFRIFGTLSSLRRFFHLISFQLFPLFYQI